MAYYGVRTIVRPGRQRHACMPRGGPVRSQTSHLRRPAEAGLPAESFADPSLSDEMGVHPRSGTSSGHCCILQSRSRKCPTACVLVVNATSKTTLYACCTNFSVVLDMFAANV
eukprot:6172816-Pleurochrysis_carterae.AAC.1